MDLTLQESLGYERLRLDEGDDRGANMTVRMN
jgi:hypothetical protein